MDFYRPEREAEVLRKALDRNHGPLRNEEIVRLFREIMSACLAQEEPLKVAFLGPEGTFTQQAVLKHFGHSVRALALSTVDEVFQEVEAGAADFGVVAIENSSEGTITNTLDRFLASALHICGEVELRIHHCLMGKMDSFARVHACVCAQSGAGTVTRLAQRTPAGSRARAGGEQCRGCAPRARRAGYRGYCRADRRGSLRAEYPGADIEDHADNSTRFLVLGRKLLRASGADRTTLLLSVRRHPVARRAAPAARTAGASTASA